MKSIDEAQLADLKDAAVAVAKNSYSPYSKFPVGAALLTESRNIFAGTNVENASYGMTICAERSAMFQAIAKGDRKPVALALVTHTPEPSTPCGACRQVLAEFNPKMEVYCFSEDGKVRRYTLDKLLLDAFQVAD